MPEACVEEFHFMKKAQSMNLWLILLIIILTLLNILVFILCKRYLNKSVISQVESKRLSSRIQNIVSNYVKINEEKLIPNNTEIEVELNKNI